MKARNQTFFASSFRKTDLPNMKENPGERTEFFFAQGHGDMLPCLQCWGGYGPLDWMGSASREDTKLLDMHISYCVYFDIRMRILKSLK